MNVDPKIINIISISFLKIIMEKMNVGVGIKELKLQTIDNNCDIMSNFTNGMTEQMDFMHKHLDSIFKNFSMQPELIECCKNILDMKEQVVKLGESMIKFNDLFIEKTKSMRENL